jgi:glycosyltransferase involved in cell wall biosynthesis
MQGINSNPIFASIVVCTYNRSDLLECLLNDLVEQEFKNQEFEIIVVDNNSTDNTAQVVEKFSQRYSNIIYKFEKKQGVSYARNCGLCASKGEYVGYVDDDCRMPKEWLQNAKDIVQKEAAAVFGGPLFACYNTNKPKWFKDEYGQYDHGMKARRLKKEYLFGANIFFRRSILIKTGGFDLHFGRSKEDRAYGGEVQPQIFIRNKFPEEYFYYDPNLYCYHLVMAKNMTFKYRIRSRYTIGRDTYRIFHGNETVELNKLKIAAHIFAILFKLNIDIILGLIKRDKKKYPYLKNYYYESTSDYFRLIGRYWQMYRSAKG